MEGPMRLAGKVALVTGGSEGIGRAVCERYLREGARVVTTARTASRLQAAVKAMGDLGEIVGFPADVSRGGDVERLVAAAVGAFGTIDVLVNNAGVLGPTGGPLGASEADWDEVMGTNLKGTWLCTLHAVRHMPSEGSIINVTSGLARGPSASYFPYGLSKHGVEALTRILAQALEQRVNAVNPGVVRTRMTGFSGAPPEGVTGVFVYLASDESRRVTGRVLDARAYRDR